MKNTTVVTDFKDLKKAIAEVTKNQPAQTRYQQQAKKMDDAGGRARTNRRFEFPIVRGDL